jgi:phospholipid N-methyltransferase
VSDIATRTPQAAAGPLALDLLSEAVRYQRWMVERMAPNCGTGILELGAGTGNLSRMLPGERLVLTEPDEALLDQLRAVAVRPPLSERSVRVAAFDPTLESGDQFHDEPLDTVVSANVLEHISDHVGALETLAALLDRTAPEPLKRIVTLVPAHPLAYGPMDREMGHYRRYTARHLRQIHAAAIPRAHVHVEGFNVIGLAGWFVSGRVLRRSALQGGTVRAVERMVPLLRLADAIARPVLPRPIGQSLISVASWI